MIKASHVYLFQCDNSDPVSHVRETLVPYYGSGVNGRYVKCEDAEETMKTILEAASEKGFQCDPDCQNILKCNIGDASALIKEASGSGIAHTLTLVDQDNKSKKAGKAGAKGGKGSKKAAKDDEEAEDDGSDEHEDDGSENGSDEDVDNDDDDDVSDEQDDDDEEEDEKPKKGSQQKGGKATVQSKGKGAAAKKGK